MQYFDIYSNSYIKVTKDNKIVYLNKTVGYQLLVFQAHLWVCHKVPTQSNTTTES